MTLVESSVQYLLFNLAIPSSGRLRLIDLRGTTMSSVLVETTNLRHRLGEQKLRIVDASWYLPTSSRDAEAEYDQGHIPTAVRFDIDRISDPNTSLPHMLPSAEAFSASVQALGISIDDDIVVYDGAGIFGAARAWWMFRVFGAERVYVLNGGMPRWVAEGGPIERDRPSYTVGRFPVRLAESILARRTDVERALIDRNAVIVDARPADRFSGATMEPRRGLRTGHMPGACSVPYSQVLNDGHMMSATALVEVFTGAGVDLSKRIITSCGSGVSAAVLMLALFELGHRENALYDGSWAEWGMPGGGPVITSKLEVS